MRVNLATVVLFTIAAISVVMTCPATAQKSPGVSPGDGLLIFNGGYISGTAEYTGQSVDGGMLTFVYEKLDFAKPISFGVSLGYGTAQADSGAGLGYVKTTANTIPFFIGGKYWLGKGRLQPYFGLALGMYFTWLTEENVSTGESYDSAGIAGGGMSIPVGLALSIGKSLFINANYTLNWLWASDFFESDIVHAFNLGVGFKLGK